MALFEHPPSPSDKKYSSKEEILASGDLRNKSIDGIFCPSYKFDGKDMAGTVARWLQAPNATFEGAIISGTDFFKADLRGAIFRGATIGPTACFVGANLAGANFCGATFIGDREKILEGAHLNGARFD